MSFWDMMHNEVIATWSKYRRTVMLFIAALIVGVLLAACAAEDNRPRLDSGKIVQIVKHDEVEVKDKKCVSTKTTTYKQNGKTKTKSVCEKYKTVTVELSPETYDFELVNGKKRGWVLGVPEDPGESYKEGDQYP